MILGWSLLIASTSASMAISSTVFFSTHMFSWGSSMINIHDIFLQCFCYLRLMLALLLCTDCLGMLQLLLGSVLGTILRITRLTRLIVLVSGLVTAKWWLLLLQWLSFNFIGSKFFEVSNTWLESFYALLLSITAWLSFKGLTTIVHWRIKVSHLVMRRHVGGVRVFWKIHPIYLN